MKLCEAPPWPGGDPVIIVSVNGLKGRERAKKEVILHRGPCLLHSLRQQSAAAVVQQVSSLVVQQVSVAVAHDLAGRARKRRRSDNQFRGLGRAALTV